MTARNEADCTRQWSLLQIELNGLAIYVNS